MNTLSLSVLAVCLALSAAQTGSDPTLTSSGPLVPTGTGSVNDPLAATGLSSLGGPMTGPGPLDALAAAAAANANTAPAATDPAAADPASANVSPVFQNPLMSYGMMGGDNLARALMVPFLSRYGNTASYYYLRGGLDKFFPVLMSDMVNSMLARSTGMNPAMSAFLTGNIFDAPDNYALSNMLFNGMRRHAHGRQGGMQSTGQQATSSLPNGAASAPASPNSLFSNSMFNPLMALAMM